MKITHHLEGTDKLRELILYISNLSEADEAFGSIKLNKLLFFSDFLAYLELGASITDQEYQKLKNGPAPRVMLPLINDMQVVKQLAIAEHRYFGRTQKRPLALREANLTRFSGHEIALVDSVLRLFKEHNATKISELSHNFAGWELAEEGETIPYGSALLETKPLTLQERQWAHDLDLTGVEELLCA